jgi:hypothetical protein
MESKEGQAKEVLGMVVGLVFLALAVGVWVWLWVPAVPCRLQSGVGEDGWSGPEYRSRPCGQARGDLAMGRAAGIMIGVPDWGLGGGEALLSGSTGIILVLIVTLIIHLVEEIKMGFRRKLPVGEMSLPLFVGINVVVYSFCFATLILSARDGRLASPFSWAFAAAMFLNGLGHVGVMVARRRYSPGGVTALLLLLLSGFLILHLWGG